MLVKLAELLFAAGIIVAAAFSARNAGEPFKVKMCLVASGPEAEDMDTEVWSDQIEIYQERYPGSYCGACGHERECPVERKQPKN